MFLIILLCSCPLGKFLLKFENENENENAITTLLSLLINHEVFSLFFNKSAQNAYRLNCTIRNQMYYDNLQFAFVIIPELI